MGRVRKAAKMPPKTFAACPSCDDQRTCSSPQTSRYCGKGFNKCNIIAETEEGRIHVICVAMCQRNGGVE